MKETLALLRRDAAEQDVKAYLEQRWEFHATCYRASGRQRLVDEVGPALLAGRPLQPARPLDRGALPRVGRALQGLPRRVRGDGTASGPS